MFYVLQWAKKSKTNLNIHKNKTILWQNRWQKKEDGYKWLPPKNRLNHNGVNN